MIFAHLIPTLAVFGIDDAIYIAMILATAASTYASYDAAQDQKEAVKRQGEANAKAQEAEAARKAAELAETQRRTAVEQRRFRAQQAAQQASNGFRLDTGTPLAVSADTYTAQGRGMADLQYGGDVENRSLLWGAAQSRDNARQQANVLTSQQSAGVISGVASIAGAGASYASSSKGGSGSSYESIQKSQEPYSLSNNKSFTVKRASQQYAGGYGNS